MDEAGVRRALVRARLDYVDAQRELVAAMVAFRAARVPLKPDRGGHLASWSDDQIRGVLRVRDAWMLLAQTRRRWEEWDRAVNGRRHR